MKKAFAVLLVLLTASICPLMAQFDTQLSNYWAAPNYYNPGYAGQSGNLELTGLYRLQWLGMERAPKSGVVLGEMPLQLLGREHGVGAVMYNDQIGLFKSTAIFGQYAFKMKLFGGSLGIGIQGGYISETFDGSKVFIPKDDEYHDPNDPGIPFTEVGGKAIDGSAGIFYKAKKWYAGLSVTHLTAPELLLNENYILDIPRSYYFTFGYNIPLNNPLIELRPSLLLKTTEVASLTLTGDSLVVPTNPNTLKGMWKQTQIDVSLRMVYNKMFWIGASWRKDESLIFMLGGQFKMLEVGYAYDVPVFSDLIKVTSGSHEVFIKYKVDMNMNKGVKNKYKSVRIL